VFIPADQLKVNVKFDLFRWCTCRYHFEQGISWSYI